MTIQELQALIVFLDRVPLTGKEALVWVRLRSRLEAELKKAQEQPSPNP